MTFQKAWCHHQAHIDLFESLERFCIHKLSNQVAEQLKLIKNFQITYTEIPELMDLNWLQKFQKTFSF